MRHIEVTAYPNAGKEVVREEGGVLKVWVTEPAEKGRANKAICRAVAKFFGIAPSCVELECGGSSRRKVVRIVC